MPTLRWSVVDEIGYQLSEKLPDIDPLTVRFTDLHQWVTELEEFTDDPAGSNEPFRSPARNNQFTRFHRAQRYPAPHVHVRHSSLAQSAPPTRVPTEHSPHTVEKPLTADRPATFP